MAEAVPRLRQQLRSADELAVHRDREASVIVLEYAVHGQAAQTGRTYDNHFVSVITIKDRSMITVIPRTCGSPLMTSVRSSPLYTGICQSSLATCNDQRRRFTVADDPVAGPYVELAETIESGNQQIHESTDSREPVY